MQSSEKLNRFPLDNKLQKYVTNTRPGCWNNLSGSTPHFWGEHAPSRAVCDAFVADISGNGFSEGAEAGTRGRGRSPKLKLGHRRLFRALDLACVFGDYEAEFRVPERRRIVVTFSSSFANTSKCRRGSSSRAKANKPGWRSQKIQRDIGVRWSNGQK